MKTCKKCGSTKPLEDFYRSNGGRDGRRPECKTCTAARRREWYAANREREIARVKAWQQANPERVNEVHRRNNARPERKLALREGYLRRTYGITQADYDLMLERQGGGCAICRRPPRPDISFHVDHDHSTGQIRGLTCFPCNNALGLMQEDHERFARAAAYLDEHDPEVQALSELVCRRTYALVGR